MAMPNRKELGNRVKNGLKEYRFFVKPTVILACVYLIALSALFRANFYYVDDMARALEGYSRFSPFSRHIASFLCGFLHGDSYLSDISPLPQILAVFITALASIIVIYVITGEKKISPWHMIAAVPIGLSPYFLECLSYKYDSPYMALSVFFAVVPLLFADGKQTAYLIWAILGTIGVCTTYQASSGIFPMLVVVLAIGRWTKGETLKDTAKFCLISAAGYVLGIVIFRVFLMTRFEAYASTEAASLSELIPCAVDNYKRYIVHFLMDFKLEWLVICFLVCVCYLWTVAAGSRRNKVLTFFLTGGAMIVLFLLSFGAYAFLKAPTFCPRSMYGICCFIGFVGIYAVANAPQYCPARAVSLVLGWLFFVFSFTYGNALNVQSQYTDFRITQALEDLSKCSCLSSEEEVTLQITGTIGYAPAVENMLEDFPVLEQLVPVTFQGDHWWGEYGLRYYYGLPENLIIPESYDPPEMDLPLIEDNYYHTVRADDTYIWIDLH